MKYDRISVILFFILFFIIGLSIYKDYGISVDEVGYRHLGITILYTLADYISPEFSLEVAKGKNYLTISDLPKTQIFSGLPFHMSAAMIEFLSKVQTKVEAFHLKHLYTFIIFFLGALFFFFLLNLKFKNYKFALLGTTFLLLSPRIFAQSFYNPNDIAFMSSIIILSFIYLKFFQKFKNKYLFFAGFASSISICLRPMAIYTPFLFVLFLFYSHLIDKFSLSTLLRKTIVFIFITVFFSYIFNPPLWTDPVSIIIQQFQWAINSSVTDILYLGKFYPNTKTPWHYLIVWISVTTPLLYLVLFIFGLLKIFLNFFEKKLSLNYKKDDLENICIFLTFLIPFASTILLSKSLLNGWRHLYFIYPFIIIISMIGLDLIIKISNKIKKLNYIIIFIIFLSLINTSYWMYKYHPFQMVYFNFLAGKNVQEKFELDYWGVSNKSAINYILENDNRKKIKIYGISNTRLDYTVDFFLKTDDKKRIETVRNINDANYIISIYNGKIRRSDILNKGFRVFNEILVDNIKINSTFVKENL